MIERSVLIVSRTPLPKEVRTNLVPPLTYEEAAELHVSLLYDLVERAISQFHVHPYIYFDPADARADFEHIFRHAGFEYKLKPAIGNKLSDKIGNAVDNIFSDGVKKLIYIDLDAALIPNQAIKHVFELLSLDDDVVVLAPDTVDQLYMIGLKKPHVQIFDALNAKDPFEVAMKISAPLSSMMFTLNRFQCIRDLAGLRKIYKSFVSNGQVVENARRTANFLQGLKEKFGEI
ncbi:MAG TPA: hypothetical protein VLX91_03075 [Candidatus Acidoferrales bacterium]|nr:hypothetical protein [Candidatus Acidoferrales bacterium]